MRAALTSVCRSAVKAVWGQEVTWSPVVGDGGPLRAVFTEAAEVVTIGESEVPLSGTAPTLRVDLSDLAASPTDGDLWVVDGVTYEVTSVHPDGHGGVTLVGVRS